jgi:hypothetical protein
MHRAVAFVSLLLAGCASFPWDQTVLASEIVGPEGGRIEAPGVALEVPAGALTQSEEISILAAEAPDERLGFLSFYRFEPDGLVFESPAMIAMAVPEDSYGAILWTRPGSDTEFQALGEFGEGIAIAELSHFSGGGPAEECRPRCHCAANQNYVGALCPSKPDDEVTSCPDPDSAIAPTPANACGLSEAASCTGYGLTTVYETICGCTGSAPWRTSTSEPTPLCRRPWRRVGTSNSWYCETDLDGQAPASGADDYATTAWKQSEGSCNGYWLDQRNTTLSSNQGPIGGTLTGCDPVPRAIGSTWLEASGTLVCDWIRTEEGTPVVCSTGFPSSTIGYPPRTAQARQESQRVVDEMNAMGLNPMDRSAVAVFTHADDTVSVGYSRGSLDAGVARDLSRRLNNGLDDQRYFVNFESDDSMTASHLCGISNTEGVCAEPRAANAARLRARSTGRDGNPRGFTPITGFDVRTRRSDNPHPFNGSNADCTAPEPNQMNACDTCGHDANVDRYMRWANGVD